MISKMYVTWPFQFANKLMIKLHNPNAPSINTTSGFEWLGSRLSTSLIIAVITSVLLRLTLAIRRIFLPLGSSSSFFFSSRRARYSSGFTSHQPNPRRFVLFCRPNNSLPPRLLFSFAFFLLCPISLEFGRLRI